jgi:nucleotide-binding universal stress UspA family protein
MKKILVAYDGGEPAHRALDMAADLAKRYEAKVGIVSVIPVHPGRVPVDPWDDRAVHTSELAEARAILVKQGIEPVLYEPAGDPAVTIEKIAQEGDYDIVVVGSRGLGVVSRALQGSVSEHVATHSQATVIIAR